jgi:hypothetical protein
MKTERSTSSLSTDMDGGSVWSPDSKRSLIRRLGTCSASRSRRTDRTVRWRLRPGRGGGRRQPARRTRRRWRGAAAEMPAGPSGVRRRGGAGGRGGAAAGFNNGNAARRPTRVTWTVCVARRSRRLHDLIRDRRRMTGRAKEFWHNQTNTGRSTESTRSNGPTSTSCSRRSGRTTSGTLLSVSTTPAARAGASRRPTV